MQREEEQRRKCGWHLIFARILRFRRLSARYPGLASPVEAYHPRAFDFIINLGLILNMIYSVKLFRIGRVIFNDPAAKGIHW